MNIAVNIRYVNVTRSAMIFHNGDHTGSSWQFQILDADGSLSGRGRPTIIGSYIDWW